MLRARKTEAPRLQPSGLLAGLLAELDPEQPFTVLHIGPGVPETVDFFCDYRCRLFFVDLFEHLPVAADSGDEGDLERQFREWLALPPRTTVDLCLFWDFFDFLEPEATAALVRVLRHYLSHDSSGHLYTVRNQRARQSGDRYGIYQGEQVRLHRRPRPLPGYRPSTPRQLQQMLNCFRFERNLLLEDGRLEISLRANL